MHKKIILVLGILIPSFLFAQTIDVFERNLSYSAYKKPLPEVLVELSEISGMNIAFDPSIISDKYNISINAENESLADLLEVVLTDTNLDYEMIGGQIVISINPFLNERGKYIISGFVEDLLSGENLVYANIFDPGTRNGTITNEYGFFSYEAEDSILILEFSYLGYQKKRHEVYYRDDNIRIKLDPNNLLNEVVIIDSKIEEEKPLEELNHLPVQNLYKMSPLAGEPDILRLVAMQPGVSSGADGLGGINVRGGSADQNLILLDGVPVYNTGHTLGMFSVFNSSMIKSARLYKDAFPSKYGGRLSSVLDIRTKEGNTEKFSGEFTLGTIASKFTLEGPISKGKSGFIVSARRSFVDSWIARASRSVKNLEGNNGEVLYNFYDLNAKLHFDLGKNSTFYLSYYGGKDTFEDETLIENRQDSIAIFENFKSSWNWGNQIISARLSSKLSNKLFLNSTAYYTHFSFNAFKNDQSLIEISRDPVELIYDASLFETRIRDFGARLDFDHKVNNINNLQYGLEFVQHNFNPGLLVVNETDQLLEFGEVLDESYLKDSLNSASEIGYETNVYLEDNIKASPHFNMVLGLRLAYINSSGESYYSLLPRIEFQTKFTKDFLWKLSFSRTNQFLHLLTTSGLGLPTDIWLPTTDQLEPQISWQASTSFTYRIKSFGSVEISGFYKDLDRILTLREGPIFDIVESGDWEFDIPTGTGLNYGMEFNLQKNYGKFTGAFSYTLSKATRIFETINNGKEYPFRYDRRHMINANVNYRINKNIELSGTGIYHTGNWVSVPTDFSSPNEGSLRVLYIYTAKNNLRLEDYIRFDLGFNIYNSYDWGRQRISIGVYNVLNRSNPFFYYFRRDDENLLKFDRKKISILPLLPSLSYSLSF